MMIVLKPFDLLLVSLILRSLGQLTQEDVMRRSCFSMTFAGCANRSCGAPSSALVSVGIGKSNLLIGVNFLFACYSFQLRMLVL